MGLSICILASIARLFLGSWWLKHILITWLYRKLSVLLQWIKLCIKGTGFKIWLLTEIIDDNNTQVYLCA